MACQLLRSLQRRSAVHTCSAKNLSSLLASGVKAAYAGFDPTANSLHVGNLAVMVCMARLQTAGFKPIWLIGGQTGGIGDPSGKSVDRPLMDRLVLEENTQGLRSDLERFIRNSEAAVQISGGNGAVQPGEIVNNATHYANMTINDFFVSVGRHMRISSMLARESVASRLQREDGLGLSLTEFAYQAFQAHDFVCLHKQHHAVLQVGGSDQWGNICAGIDLVHKVCGASVHGLTVPLITTPSGEKFGKSAGNAVWLDPAKTSHYEFYQFFLNQPDDMVQPLLGRLTLLSDEEIDEEVKSHLKAPHTRKGQTVLAKECLRLVRGDDAVRQAAAVTEVVFNKAGIHNLSIDTLRDATADAESGVPSCCLGRDVVLASTAEQVASQVGLFKSISEARRQIQAGGFYINGKRIQCGRRMFSQQDLVHGQALILRAGKKKHMILRKSKKRLRVRLSDPPAAAFSRTRVDLLMLGERLSPPAAGPS